MKVVNFFVKLVSGLFILIFGILCLTTTVFLLVKNMSSQENITNYVKNANIFDYSSRDIISDSNNGTLRQTIKNELLSMDIPSLVVDEVIDSDELDILISDYIYNYSQYILYNVNKPFFPSNDILDILVEKYSMQEGKDLSDKQKEKVLSYVELFGKKIDQSVLEKSEIDELISLNILKKIANLFDSKYMPLVLIIIMITVFAIISICLGSIKMAVNWCSKITVLNGVLLIIASLVEVRVLIMYFNNQGLIDSLVISIVENGFQNMLFYGIILIIVGIIFMTISGILLRKEKQRNVSETTSDNIVNDKITTVSENDEVEINVVEANKDEVSEDKDIESKTAQDESEEIEKVEKTVNRSVLKDNEVLQSIPNENDNKIEDELNTKETKEKEEKDQIDDNLKSLEKDEDESKQDDNTNINEEMQLLPSVEENEEDSEQDELPATEIEIEESINEDEEDSESELDISNEYSEISDDDNESEPVKKEDISIAPLSEINIEVDVPVKGNDVVFETENDQDDDIEIL